MRTIALRPGPVLAPGRPEVSPQGMEQLIEGMEGMAQHARKCAGQRGRPKHDHDMSVSAVEGSKGRRSR